MKCAYHIALIVTAILVVLTIAALPEARAAGQRPPSLITIVPAVDNSLLVNPGKGFVQYGRPDDRYTQSYIGLGYARFNWSDVEPKENVFNWKLIDDFIDRFAKHRLNAAFGVMNVSTGTGHEYVTPSWVFDDGASALAIRDDSSPSRTQIIPKTWDDPVFLAKMHTFVEALGRRYDGNPKIEYVDIRSYGNWGEGHTGLLGPDVIPTPPENLQANYFEPYFAAFQKSLLIVPWGSSYYDKIYDWAVSKGAGMRRDGILSRWSKDGSECIRAFGRAAAVFEYCDSYANTKKNGYWDHAGLMNYVDHGKPSFLQWDNQIFNENTDFILALGNKIGYHFVLTKAVLPESLNRSGSCHIHFEWLNDGVAPLYKPCHVAVALLDSNDKVVQMQWLDRCNPQKWAPGVTTAEDVTAMFPRLSADHYKLAIGLFLNKHDESPIYRLGIQGRTAMGWYVLNGEERALSVVRDPDPNGNDGDKKRNADPASVLIGVQTQQASPLTQRSARYFRFGAQE